MGSFRKHELWFNCSDAIFLLFLVCSLGFGTLKIGSFSPHVKFNSLRSCTRFHRGGLCQCKNPRSLNVASMANLFLLSFFDPLYSFVLFCFVFFSHPWRCYSCIAFRCIYIRTTSKELSWCLYRSYIFLKSYKILKFSLPPKQTFLGVRHAFLSSAWEA